MTCCLMKVQSGVTAHHIYTAPTPESQNWPCKYMQNTAMSAESDGVAALVAKAVEQMMQFQAFAAFTEAVKGHAVDQTFLLKECY